MLNYSISAVSFPEKNAKAKANNYEIEFDSSSGRKINLPNPAELLLTSLAACILKNVQRYSEILHFSYQSAKIFVKGQRNDNPPFMNKIDYMLEIQTDISDRKLSNLHKNIIKFGTITNTLSKALELKGEIKKIPIIEQ